MIGLRDNEDREIERSMKTERLRDNEDNEDRDDEDREIERQWRRDWEINEDREIERQQRLRDNKNREIERQQRLRDWEDNEPSCHLVHLQSLPSLSLNLLPSSSSLFLSLHNIANELLQLIVLYTMIELERTQWLRWIIETTENERLRDNEDRGNERQLT